MKKTLLALFLALVFVLSFTLCVSAADENESTDTEGDIILGDVNGDGVVTNADVLAIFRYIYNPELYPLPTVCNHSYGDWSVVEPTTCTNDGKLTRTCAKCSETEETIVKGGHFYEETVVPPTPADEGYTNHVCKLCGNSYKDNIVPALGFTSGFAYTKNADGKTCTITGLGSVTATSVAIPEEIDGCTVTAIGEKAFENEASITEIIIPNTVKTIGTRAFYGCTGLTEITIPASVTDIGAQIFYKASNLATVYYNSTYSSSNNPFLNLAHIQKVVFGGTKVPSYILQNASGLKEVVIPDSVTSIGDYAFEYCTSLTSVVIPDSVTSIGDYAFYNCTSLKNVYISDIEAWLNISFSSPSSNPCDNGASLYLNGELLTSVDIPDSMTEIGYAFCGCTSLESVIIPDSVTSIGSYAFYECTSLTSIEIPDSVTSIGSYAFYECTSLTSIEIPDSVTSIGSEAFYNCTSLTSVTIGYRVTSIGSNAFHYCYKLVEVINKSSLSITYQGAFNPSYGWVASHAIEVHNGDSKVVDKDGFLFYTYNGVNYLLGYKGNETEITLPDNYNGEKYEIYKYAFYNCTSLMSITIGDNVKSIGYEAFYGCTSLKDVYISNIESWLSIKFNHYTSYPNLYGALHILDSNGNELTDIFIPDSVTSIGEYAFCNCDSLKSITIPDSVTSIGEAAFSWCTSLKDVYYTGTQEQWKQLGISNYNINSATIHYNYVAA